MVARGANIAVKSQLDEVTVIPKASLLPRTPNRESVLHRLLLESRQEKAQIFLGTRQIREIRFKEAQPLGIGGCGGATVQLGKILDPRSKPERAAKGNPLEIDQ